MGADEARTPIIIAMEDALQADFNVSISETEREWKALLQQAKAGMDLDSQVRTAQPKQTLPPY